MKSTLNFANFQLIQYFTKSLCDHQLLYYLFHLFHLFGHYLIPTNEEENNAQIANSFFVND